MRYFIYLVLYLVLQLITYIITPLLPLFTEQRLGNWNNANEQRIGTRLKSWLSWFDTPDNSLEGDYNWYLNHKANYLNFTLWLYRNSLYGLKWGSLACTVKLPQNITFSGNPQINRNNGICGIFNARYKDYWQYKIVKKLVGNWGTMFNFGWQLDDFVKSGKPGTALFQFSPRFCMIK